MVKTETLRLDYDASEGEGPDCYARWPCRSEAKSSPHTILALYPTHPSQIVGIGSKLPKFLLAIDYYTTETLTEQKHTRNRHHQNAYPQHRAADLHS
jgi:hypothetical protein